MKLTMVRLLSCMLFLVLAHTSAQAKTQAIKDDFLKPLKSTVITVDFLENTGNVHALKEEFYLPERLLKYEQLRGKKKSILHPLYKVYIC